VSETLEQAIVSWARSRVEPGQVTAWPLRARAETVDGHNITENGKWVHVHDEHKWVTSVKRSPKGRSLTVYVPQGVRVVVEEAP
jgi:hypothetical protein